MSRRLRARFGHAHLDGERNRAQQARILQDIVALRDEMQERLRRRGDAA